MYYTKCVQKETPSLFSYLTLRTRKDVIVNRCSASELSFWHWHCGSVFIHFSRYAASLSKR